MSYCSLEEAWGTPSLKQSSRAPNSLGEKNGISYSVSNQSEFRNNNKIVDRNVNRNVNNTNKRIINNSNSRTNNSRKNVVNYNLINNSSNNNSIEPVSSTINDFSFLDTNLNNDPNLFSEVPQNGNHNNLEMNEEDLSLINSENIQDGSPKPLNPFQDNLGHFNNLNDDLNDDSDVDDDFNNNENSMEQNLVAKNNVELNVDSEMEGFQNSNLNETINNNNNSDLTQKMLMNILDRLDEIERKINTSKSKKNNVHDIILFIIIGIFVLFALDSVFRIGRSTV